MLDQFSRTEIIIGTKALNKLKSSKVAVFGIGGVGTYVVEALVRSAVGELVLIDDDDIDITNLNRQIHATTKTIGMAKVEAMKERALEINPNVKITTHKKLYNKLSAESLLEDDYDYVVDAIDMVSSKLDLIERCKERNIPIISAMGAGNKFDPTRLMVADIKDTIMCPLAKVMRKELRKRNIKNVKVVYSPEEAVKPMELEKSDDSIASNKKKRQTPGTMSFLPSTSGLIIASEVVKDLIEDYLEK